MNQASLGSLAGWWSRFGRSLVVTARRGRGLGPTGTYLEGADIRRSHLNTTTILAVDGADGGPKPGRDLMDETKVLCAEESD